jgi:hypothetical protein
MATQDLAVQRLKPRGSKRKQGLLSERANASQSPSPRQKIGWCGNFGNIVNAAAFACAQLLTSLASRYLGLKMAPVRESIPEGEEIEAKVGNALTQ